MNTKEKLSQYKSLSEETKELEERIKTIDRNSIQCDSVKGSSKEFPYILRNFRIEGVDFSRTKKLRHLLYTRKLKCEKLQNEIEQFISEIPDSLTRRVFEYRYIDCMSWQEIAYRIGEIYESYPRRDIHDKYMKTLE